MFDVISLGLIVFSGIKSIRILSSTVHPDGEVTTIEYIPLLESSISKISMFSELLENPFGPVH